MHNTAQNRCFSNLFQKVVLRFRVSRERKNATDDQATIIMKLIMIH
jgi:hypothetical protein